MSQSKPVPVSVWADYTTTYAAPGKAWNGTLVSQKPAVPFFTPDVKPAAEDINYLFATYSRNIQSLQDWCGNSPALNWYPQVANTAVLGAATALESCVWDPLGNRWLMLIVENGGTPIATVWSSQGLDQGSQWSQIGSNVLPGYNIVASAVCADPTSAGNAWQALVYSDGSSHYGLNILYWNNVSWTLYYTTATPQPYAGVEMCTLGSTVIVLMAGSSGVLGYSTANSGVYWTPFSFSVASLSYMLQSNGSLAVAFPYGTAQSVFSYWTSSDGITWTNRTMPYLNGNVAVAQGLVWTQDAQGPCWLLAAKNGSSAITIYRSADGINWSIQQTLTQTFDIAGMSAIGPLVVATLADSYRSGPSGQIFSPDGGVSWYSNTSGFSSNALPSTAGYTRSRVVASPYGFLSWNTNWFRFSHSAGLGVQLG